MPSPDAQVRRKAQPRQVRDLQQPCGAIDGAPNIRQVAIQSDQTENINARLHRTLGREEQGHPYQVQAQLDRIQRHGPARKSDGFRVRQGRQACCEGAMGGVSHYTVQNGPDGTKHPWWGSQRGLLQGHVRLLRAGWARREPDGCAERDGEEDG